MKNKLLSLLLLAVALIILIGGLFTIRQQYSQGDDVVKTALARMGQ